VKPGGVRDHAFHGGERRLRAIDCKEDLHASTILPAPGRGLIQVNSAG
jgi:hypothetical protein